MDKRFTLFRKQSLAQLKNLQTQDVVIFQNEFVKSQYTLVAHPKRETIQKIEKLKEKLKKIEINQCYYPSNQLHLTILGGLSPKNSLKKIRQAVAQLITQPLSFNLYGLASNQYCGSISAYPDFDLYSLRQKLRDKIGHFGTDYTKHLLTYKYMGWINIFRYLRQPSQNFLDFLYQQKDKSFGKLILDKLEIYLTTSKLLDQDKSELVYSQKLC